MHETLNLFNDADSRTDTILRAYVICLNFFLFYYFIFIFFKGGAGED